MTKFKIPAGGMYQEWMGQIGLMEKDIAPTLNEITVGNGWYEVKLAGNFKKVYICIVKNFKKVQKASL